MSSVWETLTLKEVYIDFLVGLSDLSDLGSGSLNLTYKF